MGTREENLKYYWKNREKILEKSRLWRLENKERSRENTRRWEAANPDRVKESKKKFHQKHKNDHTKTANKPEYKLFHAAKMRSKKYGTEFNIDLADIVIPEYCPVFGTKIKVKEVTSHKGQMPDSPSLDRIDPNRGYVKGNTQVISWRANKVKNNSTLQELKQLVSYLEGHEKRQHIFDIPPELDPELN